MNSGLQCLCHLEPLVGYFLSQRYEGELRISNPKGSGGRLARSFASLVQALWHRGDHLLGPHTPSEIHSSLKSVVPHMFSSFQQQDVQEFLAYMIDGLHEDLNLASGLAPISFPVTALASPGLPQSGGQSEDSQEYEAACAWVQYLSRDKGCMVDLFQGQLRSCLTCLECNYRSSRFDPFLYMSVQVTRRMKTLEEAISAFLAGETLSGSEQWHCERCKKKVDATKKIDLWKMPPVLVLHLKRFEHSLQFSRSSKIDVPIVTGLRGLDFSQHMSSPQRSPPIYDLCSVAHHSGSVGFGHYTASCRDPRDGTWRVFDDERVEPLSEEDVVGRTAYVLFLARRSAPGRPAAAAGGETLRQTVSDPASWPHLCGPPPVRATDRPRL